MTPKEFALQAIAPYFKDFSLCGFDSELNQCRYITHQGKTCVAGKYMKEDFRQSIINSSIEIILSNHSQSEVFIPEVVDVLTSRQWQKLQSIHDCIARSLRITDDIEELNLFTLEELQNYGRV